MLKRVSIIIILLNLAACSAPSTFPLQDPDASYELDTWAENSEIYEFTPKANSNIACVVFILDNLNTASMQCFPKDNNPGS